MNCFTSSSTTYGTSFTQTPLGIELNVLLINLSNDGFETFNGLVVVGIKMLWFFRWSPWSCSDILSFGYIFWYLQSSPLSMSCKCCVEFIKWLTSTYWQLTKLMARSAKLIIDFESIPIDIEMKTGWESFYFVVSSLCWLFIFCWDFKLRIYWRWLNLVAYEIYF